MPENFYLPTPTRTNPKQNGQLSRASRQPLAPVKRITNSRIHTDIRDIVTVKSEMV